jgi:hypothetical protein
VNGCGEAAGEVAAASLGARTHAEAAALAPAGSAEKVAATAHGPMTGSAGIAIAAYARPRRQLTLRQAPLRPVARRRGSLTRTTGSARARSARAAELRLHRLVLA